MLVDIPGDIVFILREILKGNGVIRKPNADCNSAINFEAVTKSLRKKILDWRYELFRKRLYDIANLHHN